MKIKREDLEKILDCIFQDGGSIGITQCTENSMGYRYVTKKDTINRLIDVGIEIEKEDYLAKARDAVIRPFTDRTVLLGQVEKKVDLYEKAIKQLQEKIK
jgi:radical SAM superfamily enzyme